MSETREIAERVAAEYAPTHTLRKLLTIAIDKALRDRDERAAKIVERARENETGPYLNAIAAAIREGKPQE